MALEQSGAAPVRTSRVGKRPIVLPKGVAVTVSGRKVEVKGPKGTLGRELSDGVAVKVLTGDNELVSRKICREVGIATDAVLLGTQVEGMSDAELAALNRVLDGAGHHL